MRNYRLFVISFLFLYHFQSVSTLEAFSSIGKYDYGHKGFLLKGVEIELIYQEGPGIINSFQFAADFEGYDEVRFEIYKHNYYYYFKLMKVKDNI